MTRRDVASRGAHAKNRANDHADASACSPDASPRAHRRDASSAASQQQLRSPRARPRARYPAMSPVHLARDFTVSPMTVYAAWIDPTIMRRWLFKSPTNEIREFSVNPRVGAAFSIREHTEDNDIVDHYGHYRELLPPTRLAFTLRVPRHFPGETLVTVDISPTRTGSHMQFTQTGVDPSITEKPWSTMFDTLEQVLTTPNPRLSIPRPITTITNTTVHSPWT